MLRLYLDGFSINNPLGSSADKDKIVGVYYTACHDQKIASQRQTVQNVALIKQEDISNFGLSRCLNHIIAELQNIIIEGLWDDKFKKKLNVRVICSLGDNLGNFLHFVCLRILRKMSSSSARTKFNSLVACNLLCCMVMMKVMIQQFPK